MHLLLLCTASLAHASPTGTHLSMFAAPCAVHMQLDQAIKRLQQQTADLEQQQQTLSQQLQEETSRQPDAVRCQARAADCNKDMPWSGAPLSRARRLHDHQITCAWQIVQRLCCRRQS